MEKSAVGVGDGGRPGAGSRDSGGVDSDKGAGGNELWEARKVDAVILVLRTGKRDGPAFGPSSAGTGSGVE